MWRRGDPALSPLKSIPAGIYVCFNTNAATATAFSTTLCGTPSAPRLTWHPSTTNEPMNLIGFSLAAGQSIPIGNWLNGFTGGNVDQFFTINGLDDGKIGLSMLNSGSKATDGQVVVMTCNKASSRADFLAKVNIALKEAHETLYWIELLGDNGFLTKKNYESISDDCHQMIAMLVSTRKTLTTKEKSYE